MTHLRSTLSSPLTRLAVATAFVLAILAFGLSVVTGSRGSVWGPLVAGPIITFAGYRLFNLARAWLTLPDS